MKLNIYKTWDNKDNEDTDHDEEFVYYEIKYKIKFKEYFHYYYEDSTVWEQKHKEQEVMLMK